MKRILLGQLASNGDCLYATTIARQIKHDFPGCHLTWGIGSACRAVIDNNPDVDSVWEIDLSDLKDTIPVWDEFEREALKRRARQEFDEVFLTQIFPGNLANFDGTIRPSLFRNYERPVTVPVETVISLTDREVAAVGEWVRGRRLDSFEHLVVFECSSLSDQSFMTPELAMAIAGEVINRDPGVAFVLSTRERLASDNPRIVSGHELTMRETAALTSYATLFVGCGSGLTVIATSAAAKPRLPNIQVLSQWKSVYASFRHDFEYFGKSADNFLETTSLGVRHLATVIETALQQGIAVARERFAQPVALDFSWYLTIIDTWLVQKRRFVDAARSLTITAGRYGWRLQLRNYARHCVEPFLALDPAAARPERRSDLDRFMAAEIFRRRPRS